MFILLFIAFIAIIWILLELLKGSRSQLIPTFICSILIVGILFNPKASISYALEGAILFFNAIFPSIFPFLILINMIIGFGGIKFYSNFLGGILCKPLQLPRDCSIVILTSCLCGYPLGSKYACDLFSSKIIDYDTTDRLLNIASNASPIFILGTLGATMFRDIRIGYLILISHYFSCFLMSIIIKPKSRINYKVPINKTFSTSYNIGETLRTSVEDSINTTLLVGGFIILFSVITGVIKNSILIEFLYSIAPSSLLNYKDLVSNIFLGTLEMTNGCNLICTANIATIIKICLCSFFISFSGFSVIAQIYSFTYKYNFKIGKYILKKFMQGIICCVSSILLYIPLNEYLSVSSNIVKGQFNPLPFYIVLVLLLIPLILKKLFKSIF
ncbi:MAG: sporulation integral membrane protein YlbJ [Clostridium sp.]